MPDIFHDLTIRASRGEVFRMVATAEGLDQWWTARCSGTPATGNEYSLYFDPKHDWKAVVTDCLPDSVFELRMTDAGYDWTGTIVRFELLEHSGSTRLRFSHLGWSEVTDHFRVTSFCWASYLRLLKRAMELGEVCPADQRYES